MTALAHHRHEALAQRRVYGLALGESQAASYRALYPKAKPASAAAAASRLLHSRNVVARIEELQQIAARRHQTKIDTITEHLFEAHDLAIKHKQASAAVAASMGLAKLHGLIISRSERVEHDTDPLDMLVEEIGAEAALRQLDAMRARLVRRISANRD